tara:strand:+ start:919 stop:2538 length:1620 start_codon:yes stop_codon:yes gene_type:complete
MASIFSNKKTQNKNQETNTIKDNRTILNEYNPNQNTFTQALGNIDESSKQLVNDIITPFLNPVQTAKDLYSLSKSVASLIPGVEGDDTQAKAVGKFFKDRYGSLESIKQTFATDPVGMLSDVSIILTGGATLAPKASATASVLSKASKIASPIETAGGFAIGKAAQGSGTLGKQVSGYLTGTGVGALDTAIKTGKNYGATGFFASPTAKQKQKDFLDSLNEKISTEQITTDLEKAVSELKKSTKIDYQNKLAGLKLQDVKIQPSLIAKQFNEFIRKEKTKGGTTRFGADTNNFLETIYKELNEISKNPAKHTAADFHQLKFKIDDMLPKDLTTQTSRVNMELAGIIDNAIASKSSGYLDMNKAYSTAKKLEQKFIDDLAVGNKKNATQTMNRLLSVLKDQNLTNYGARLESLKLLDNITEQNLFEKLAGTQLSGLIPRGNVGKLTMGGSIVVPMAEAMLTGTNFVPPSAILPGLALTSPKIAGTTGNILGRVQGLTKNLPVLGLLQRPTANLRGARVSGMLGLGRDDSVYQNQSKGLLQ